MAIVVANAAVDPVALFNYFHSFSLTLSEKERTATGVRVTLAPGEYVDFNGNFVFSPLSDVLPIAGTGTSIKVVKDGALQYSVTGLNLDVRTVYSYTSPVPGEGKELGLGPIALAGNDTATGSKFVDKLDGHNGNDTISGRGGNDIIDGMAGQDKLRGEVGNDIVLGGAGHDTLDGGVGNDRLTGGTGNDFFVFNTPIPARGANATNVDRITDFNVGNDTIQIDNAVFKGLAAGSLKAAAFKVGTQATDSSDRIIYNRATGDLFFDANGSAGPATDQVKFAHLDKVAGAALFPAVSVADFLVI